jgi:hypothetical protein
MKKPADFTQSNIGLVYPIEDIDGLGRLEDFVEHAPRTPQDFENFSVSAQLRELLRSWQQRKIETSRFPKVQRIFEVQRKAAANGRPGQNRVEEYVVRSLAQRGLQPPTVAGWCQAFVHFVDEVSGGKYPGRRERDFDDFHATLLKLFPDPRGGLKKSEEAASRTRREQDVLLWEIGCAFIRLSSCDVPFVDRDGNIVDAKVGRQAFASGALNEKVSALAAILSENLRLITCGLNQTPCDEAKTEILERSRKLISLISAHRLYACFTTLEGSFAVMMDDAASKAADFDGNKSEVLDRLIWQFIDGYFPGQGDEACITNVGPVR